MPPRKRTSTEAEKGTSSSNADSSVEPANKRSRRSDPESETAVSKVAEAKEKAELEKGWKIFNGVLTFMPDPAPAGNPKILGFDIDDTIIRTKSGKTFATSSADWVFWHPSVPAKLQEAHNNGFKIVFFSNQGGISKGQTTAAMFKSKLNAVLAEIPVPVQIYASTENGKYRKPCVGMWGMFSKGGNQGVRADPKLSCYVGDAAGRGKDWQKGKKKDFSDSDRKFALNLEMEFKTPEEFFLGEAPVPFKLEGADPKLHRKNLNGPLFEPATAKLVAGHQELVVMVGYPGSGKSFFTVQELEGKGGYTRVNRDTLKTKERCIKTADEALGNGKSVVIDNTNPDADTRSDYLALAKRHKVPARCFVMQTSFDEAMHNNMFRELVSNGEHEHVPTMVYHMFKKKYVEPTVKEGFTEVVKTYFRPKFDDPEKEKLFYQWTPL